MEIKIDENQIADTIIENLKRHNLIGKNEEKQNVTVIYNAESQDVLYTVAETAKLLKTGVNDVYELIRAGLLPALKLSNMKIRKVTLEEFFGQIRRLRSHRSIKY